MGSILSMQWPISEAQQRRRQLPSILLGIAGAVHQVRGRVSVLRGTLSHNDILRAVGYRQQLVGLLQRFWRKDRSSVEAWVDALLRKNVVPTPVARTAWRPRSAPLILSEEAR
jgi:hypothetical protein